MPESLAQCGTAIAQTRLHDGFYCAARAELDRCMRRERRHNQRYEMTADEAERFLRLTEHELRVRAFREVAEPFVAQKCRLMNLCPVGYWRNSDGSLTMAEMPEWITKALGEYDRIIAMVAEQHGLKLEVTDGAPGT